MMRNDRMGRSFHWCCNKWRRSTIGHRNLVLDAPLAIKDWGCGWLAGAALWLTLLAFVAVTPVQSVEITTQTGDQITGDITSSSNNSVVIRVYDGGVRLMPYENIHSVRLVVDQIGTVEGVLQNWEAGVYLIKSENEFLRIKDGVLLERVDAVGKGGSIGSTARKNLALWQPKQLNLISGDPNSSTYKSTLGIATLVKMTLYPKYGIDFIRSTLSGVEEVADHLADGSALAITDLSSLQDLIDFQEANQVRHVATLWKKGENVYQIVASARTATREVFEITRVIFENLPFLINFEPNFSRVSLDDAMHNQKVPLHPGAMRYYRKRQVLQSQQLEQDAPLNNGGIGSRIQM